MKQSIDISTHWKAINAQMPKEAQMFGEVYCFFQQFYRGDGSDEYWEVAIDCAGKLKAKYNNDPLVHKLLLEVLDELEHRERREKRYATKSQ